MVTQDPPPILHDFNGAVDIDEDGFSLVLRPRSVDELRDQGIAVIEGATVRVFDPADEDEQGHVDPLVGEGTIHFDQKRGAWTLRLCNRDVVHVSEVRDASHWARGLDWHALLGGTK